MRTRKKLFYRFRWKDPWNKLTIIRNHKCAVFSAYFTWCAETVVLTARRKRFCKEVTPDKRKGELYLSRRHRKQGHPLKEIALAELRGFNSKCLLWLTFQEVF